MTEEDFERDRARLRQAEQMVREFAARGDEQRPLLMHALSLLLGEYDARGDDAVQLAQHGIIATVSMNAEDFWNLMTDHMEWSSNRGWREKGSRFYTYNRGEEINFDFAHAYWFADRQTMWLARGFLQAIGVAHQVLRDDAHSFPFLIVADYDSDIDSST